MKGNPVIVGLLGGIASGKSTVAGFLRDLGARVIDADAIAHEVIERPEVVARVVRALGRAVVGADGRLSRARIGEIVFADADALRKLEAIVHPEVRRRIHSEIAAAAEQLIVLDAPLILEGELARLTGVLVFVESPESERRARATRRSGWTSEEHELRESRQASLEEKKREAALIIRNDGSLEELRRAVGKLHRELLARRRREDG